MKTQQTKCHRLIVTLLHFICPYFSYSSLKNRLFSILPSCLTVRISSRLLAVPNDFNTKHAYIYVHITFTFELMFVGAQPYNKKEQKKVLGGKEAMLPIRRI